MALHVRELTEEEKKKLEYLLDHPEESPFPVERLMIVYLSSHGTKVQQIAETVGMHPINVRKWIHRFNARGFEGLVTRKSPGRPRVFSEEQRRRIVEIAQTPPDKLGLERSRWSLQRLRRYLIEQGIVDRISVETIRQILQEHGIEYRPTQGWGGTADHGHTSQANNNGYPGGGSNPATEGPRNRSAFSRHALRK